MKSSHNLRDRFPGRKPDDTLARFLRQQSPLARWSYVVGVVGAVLAIHDFHHPQDSFGYSTPILGVAILLYVLSLRPARHP